MIVGIKSLTEVVAVEKSVTSKLGKTLSDALTVLGYGMEIPLFWEPNDGEQAVTLATLEAKVNAYTSAFNAKEKYKDGQLVIIRKALSQAREKVSKLVSDAMNADGNKLRQGIAELNKTMPEKRILLNVNTKDRKFAFSVQEKPNDMDTADAILAEAGVSIPDAKPADAKHQGGKKS